MSKPIQVIERAIAVLESVASASGEGRSLRDIASETGLKLPTAARIAQSLLACGYLEQKVRKKGYLLGRKALSLSSSREPFRRLIELAKSPMWKFSEATGEYIDLSVLHRNKRVVLHYMLSSKSVQVFSAPEDNEAPYRSLSGRLLLAGLPEEAQRKAFRANGLPGESWPEVCDEESFVKALAGIRKAERLFRELDERSCMSLPILEDGACVATLGVYLPSYRYKGELVGLIESSLFEAKRSIELGLRS